MSKELVILGLIFFLSLSLLMGTNAQTGDPQYHTITPIGDFLIGIKTNAPLSQNPFSYEYHGFFQLTVDVFDFNQIDVVTSFSLRLNNTVFDNYGELSVEFSKMSRLGSFYSNLTGIYIGLSRISFNENTEDKLFNYEASTNHSIIFTFDVTFGSLQTLQVVPLGSLKFDTFLPSLYSGGSIEFQSWVDDFLPLFTIDTVLLPIAAVGAALYILLSQQASNLQTQIEDFKESASDFTSSHTGTINSARAAKETIDFTSDLYQVNQQLRNEDEEGLISKFGKFLLSIYFLLLITVIVFFYTESMYLETITQIFLIYTTVILLLSLIYTISSSLSVNVLTQIGKSIPLSHPIFGVMSIIIFVIIPFNYLQETISTDSIGKIIGFMFLTLITSGFVILALFAGYYLAKSGISWSILFSKISRKLKIPHSLTKLSIRLFTIIFSIIVILKLMKTTALILAILFDSEISSNAYLVSLAASYLKEEMMVPEIISYGLLLVFFIQTIMAIFLHIRIRNNEFSEEIEGVMRLYQRLSLFLLIALLSFLYILFVLKGDILGTSFAGLILTPQEINTLNVWNLIFVIPPFRLLLDILLAIGLVISLPISLYHMWKISVDVEK